MATADRLFRKILAATRFFSKGWGPPEAYECLLDIFPHLNNRSEITALLADHSHPITTTKVKDYSWGSVLSGWFVSPLSTLCPGILPQVATRARFEFMQPKTWPAQDKPVYIHLAGTGDHGFWRRHHMTALPLLKDVGIGALLLENPYYGSRKPKGQRRSQLNHVSDLFVMGLALILECVNLIGWLEKAGFGPVGLTGISMGGHNASLAACACPQSVPVVPCLSWSSAASAFTEGILSESVCWDVLEDQLRHTRQGHNDRLLSVFRSAAERQSSGKYSSLSQSCDRSHQSMQSSDQSLHDTRLHTIQPCETNKPSCDQSHDASTLSCETNRPSCDQSHDASTLSCETNKLSCDQSHDTSSLFPSHPTIVPVQPRVYRSSLHKEAVSLMQAVLNSATHFNNFTPPSSSELALFITAHDDIYIPRHNLMDVRDLWPGCRVEYVSGGHVSSVLLQQTRFRNGLAETMGRVVGRDTVCS